MLVCLGETRRSCGFAGRNLYEIFSLINQNFARKVHQLIHGESTQVVCQVRSGCRVVDDADGMTPVCRALSVRMPLD
jgi:hypothetical protein